MSLKPPASGQAATITGDTPRWDGLLTLSRFGTLTTGAGLARLRVPAAITIRSVAATVGTAPTGSSLIVDVNVDGASMFTTQANRPTVAAGAFNSSDSLPDIGTVGAGSYITVDVDQVGSTVGGSDLVLVVQYLTGTLL